MGGILMGPPKKRREQSELLASFLASVCIYRGKGKKVYFEWRFYSLQIEIQIKTGSA
jgi:hypothetical protein